MAIDNLNLLQQFLVFDNTEDDYYLLQTIQRRKEHPDLKINNRVVDTVYIYSGDLERKYDRIKQRAEYFNARVYLRLNRRSAEATAKYHLVKIAQLLQQNNFKAMKDAYSSSAGEHHSDPNKKWLLDIDGEMIQYKNLIVDSMNEVPYKKGTVLAEVPTKNGIHLITDTFNQQDFQRILSRRFLKEGIEFSGIDIHKDNPTLLYYKEPTNA